MPAFDALDTRFRGSLRDCGWALCVGAGISIGMLPSWAELSRRVLSRALDSDVSVDDFVELSQSSGWSFDAWIQAGLNAHLASGGSESSFSSIVEEALYADLLAKAASWGVEKGLVAAFLSPQLVNSHEFQAVTKFLEVNYPHASALPLGLLLAEAAKADLKPQAIITFNYDTILETVIRMREIAEHQSAMGRHIFPESTYRRVTGPLLKSSPKVPFIYLHGCVTPRPLRRLSTSPHDSRERLVGPESSYLRLTGSPISWAQTTFMHHAQNKSLAIVGHSLSDPNLRRWLAWAATLRNQEVKLKSGRDISAQPHIWIRRRPSRASHKLLLERALTHLGVRIAWLDSWADLRPALANLLALPKSGKPIR